MKRNSLCWVLDVDALGAGVALLFFAVHYDKQGDQWFAGLVGFWLMVTSLSRIVDKLREG